MIFINHEEHEEHILFYVVVEQCSTTTIRVFFNCNI